MNKTALSHRLLFILLILPVLGGCVYFDNQPYPSNWGQVPPITDHSCTDISGEFKYTCENGAGKAMGGCLLLFWDRFEMREFAPASYDSNEEHVTIEQSPARLKVSLLTNEKVIAQKVLTKDAESGFSCTNEGIVVSNGKDAFSQNLLGYMPGSNTLFKGNDGRLIVRFKEAGGGLLLGFIPVFGGDTLWNRVDPYKKP
jgi:hypothetical protein